MTHEWWQSVWASRGLTAIALWPLSRVYALLAWLDRVSFQCGLRKIRVSSVPVVVIGNLTVGGTGKSPLVAWLCEALLQEGLRPGIVSRGYGGQIRDLPHRVTLDDTAARVGDEPLMLAQQTGRPVCVCSRRSAAVAMLEASGEVDVVLSDDGLQHHAMARHVEIVVVDQARGFGNRWRLPAGPLRDSVQRMEAVDTVVYQRRPGSTEDSDVASFVLKATDCRLLNSGDAVALSSFAGQRVHAVAAIGRPMRFFETLELAGVEVIQHALPDHHPLQPSDVTFSDELAVLITAKDAVKLDVDGLSSPVHVVQTQLLPSPALLKATESLVSRLRSCPASLQEVDS